MVCSMRSGTQSFSKVVTWIREVEAVHKTNKVYPVISVDTLTRLLFLAPQPCMPYPLAFRDPRWLRGVHSIYHIQQTRIRWSHWVQSLECFFFFSNDFRCSRTVQQRSRGSRLFVADGNGADRAVKMLTSDSSWHTKPEHSRFLTARLPFKFVLPRS